MTKQYPTNNPIIIPVIMDIGIFTNSIISTLLPVARPVKAENITITNTSSTDAPANINCGILFFVP